MPDKNYAVLRNVPEDAIRSVKSSKGQSMNIAKLPVDDAFAREAGLPDGIREVHAIIRSDKQIRRKDGMSDLSFYADKPVPLAYYGPDKAMHDIKGVTGTALAAGVVPFPAPGTQADGPKTYVTPDGDRIPAGYARGIKDAEVLRIADSVKYIDGHMFTDMPNLKQVILGSGLEYIGEKAFEGCDALERVDAARASNLKFVGEGAFRFCGSLDRPDLDSSVDVGRGAFDFGKGMSRDLKLTLPDGSDCVVTMDRLYAGSLPKWDAAPCSIEFPEGMTAVIDCVANDSRNLTKVVYPASMEWVGIDSFRNCPRLTDLEYAGNLPEIPLNAGDMWDRFHPEEQCLYGIDSAGRRLGRVGPVMDAYANCPCERQAEADYAAYAAAEGRGLNAEHMALVREINDRSRPELAEAYGYSDGVLQQQRQALYDISYGENKMNADMDTPVWLEGKAQLEVGSTALREAELKLMAGAEKGLVDDKCAASFRSWSNLPSIASAVLTACEARSAGTDLSPELSGLLAEYDECRAAVVDKSGPYRTYTLEELTVSDNLPVWPGPKETYAYHKPPVDIAGGRGEAAEAALGGMAVQSDGASMDITD